MSELARPIPQHEFESGLESRLRVGEVVVGQLCALRLKVSMLSNGGQPIRDSYSELAVAIEEVNKKSEDNTEVSLTVDLLRSEGDMSVLSPFSFDRESLVNERTRRTLAQLYLADKAITNWDDELKTLADNELLILLVST